MSPLQQIKSGIEKQDWSLVIAGYQAIAGETITPPKKPRKTKAKAQTQPQPQRITVEDNPDKFFIQPLPQTQSAEGSKRIARKEPFQAPSLANNQFVDTGELYNPQDEKLYQGLKGRNAPVRPVVKLQMVQVVCGKCSRTYEVDSRDARFGTGDDAMMNICPPCMKNSIRR